MFLSNISFRPILIFVVILTIILTFRYWLPGLKQGVRSLFRQWWSIYAFFALLTGSVLVYLDVKADMFSKENIRHLLSEAHGIVIELVVFIILFGFYDRRRERKERIHQYLEELEDYQIWEGEEATYRKIGLLKRLIKLRVESVSLKNHRFVKGTFAELSFDKINLNRSHFEDCSFRKCRFTRQNINFCKLVNCSIRSLSVEGIEIKAGKMNSCKFSNGAFKNVNIRFVEFDNSSFLHVEFINCNFDSVSFKNVSFSGESDFQGCEFEDCDFDEAIFPDLTKEQLKTKIGEWMTTTGDAKEFLSSYQIRFIGETADEDLLTHLLPSVEALVQPSKKGCVLFKV